MAYGGLAAGLLGAASKAGEIADENIKSKRDEKSKLRVMNQEKSMQFDAFKMQKEVEFDYQSRIAENARQANIAEEDRQFKRQGEIAPEENRRQAEAQKAKDRALRESTTEGANDAAYIAAAKKIANASRPDERVGANADLIREGLKLDIENKKALAAIPPAARKQIETYQDELKNIDKMIREAKLKADGEVNPQGLADLQKERSALATKIQGLALQHGESVSVNPEFKKLYQNNPAPKGAIAGAKVDKADSLAKPTEKKQSNSQLTIAQQQAIANKALNEMNPRDSMSIYKAEQVMKSLSPNLSQGYLKKLAEKKNSSW